MRNVETYIQGVNHLTICNICNDKLLEGMRWHCTDCDNYDLCTLCYMSDHDDTKHEYFRIEEQNQEPVMMPTRESSAERKLALGIFKGSKVYDPKRKDDAIGEVKKICSYKINIARNAVLIDGQTQTKAKEKIRNLKSESRQKPTYYYFPDHLPDLGNDTCGYITTTHNGKKITVKFWFLNRNEPSVRDERPRLYIIFAIGCEGDHNIAKKIKEIHKLSKENKIPCHLVAEKILIFEDIVVVHKNTTDEIVKLLLDMDGFNLNRGDIDAEEGEIMYFKRMAEYCCSDLCLPVFISLKNGKMMEIVRKAAAEECIPVISFKRESVDAIVITFQKDKDTSAQENKSVKEIEHVFDVKTPWARKRHEEINSDIKKREKDEIQSIQELRYLSNLSFDALVCYLLIGVSMAGSEENLFGKYSKIYPNALSMYLLKEGKWKIPKDIIKKYFSHQSIEYILEEKMDDEFKHGLWQDLSIKSNRAYRPPTWKDKGKQNGGFLAENEDRVDFSQDYQPGALDVRTSELYGLIFYALLRRNFHEGAKQLIETGGVRIRHILIGCVILKETEDDWRTTQLEKEKMQELQKIFSHQALRIISCMHEADNPSVIKKRQGDMKKDGEELGEQIQHAGRLLLNHGCLTDAIKTKNKIFLGNNTVKDILNHMWYGKKTLSIRRRFLFLLLTLLHILLLPILMINMEHKPLRWLYKQYKIPVMKVLLNLVGLLALLTGYAYMLLFDFKENGISISDYFIIAWMVSFFIDETKQMLIAFFRGKMRSYASDKWNILDWLSIGTYLSGMMLKIGDSVICDRASRILLVLAFIMLCVRVLNLFCISELLGPKLVIIQKMFLDTFGFMAIMTVITICYNVSYYTILYSENSDFSFEQLEKVTRNGYWMLFGELNLETDRLTEPDCTFNKTIYMSGAMERCPSELGRFLAPYLKAIYGLVAVILMLNLLIAMYSHTFSKVQEKSELYWTQLQTNFLEEYSVKSIFPIHMQLPAFLAFIIQFIVWFTIRFLLQSIKHCCNNNDDYTDTEADDKKEVKLNHTPMFVRVFLYDSNFDLELTRTRKAEGYAALRVKGEMTFAEKDKLTVLQDEIQELEKNLTDKHEKLLEEKIRKIDSKVEEIRHILLGFMKKESKTQENQNLEEEINIATNTVVHSKGNVVEHPSLEAENNVTPRQPLQFERAVVEHPIPEAENNTTPRRPSKFERADNTQQIKARRSLKFEESRL